MFINLEAPKAAAPLSFAESHLQTGLLAQATYLQKFGCDYHTDPNWAPGNDRDLFWMGLWDAFWNAPAAA